MNCLFRGIVILQTLLCAFSLWGNENYQFYNTVTVTDFEDANYINQIKNLNIGIELALLTPISNELLSDEQYKIDLSSLKTQVNAFLECFKKYQIPVEKVRLHQPAGYTYYWFDRNFNFMNDFFKYCRDLGIQNYVLHTPFGDSNNDAETELKDYWNKLQVLSLDNKIEVEEIIASNNDLKQSSNLRFYNGALFERLLTNQKATMLLDVHECGSANQTIVRMNDLISKGFELHSFHIHKDKHKILPNDELNILLNSNFRGNIINEGFLQNDSSFEEFARTKSSRCIVPNDQRIEILRGYVNLGELHKPS
jgi:hypothetical protein